MNNTVTINLSKESHYLRPYFKEGEIIKLAKNSWFMARQRIKNKMMVHRLLKKEYYPYLIATEVNSDVGETTLTLKPYNF